MRRSTHEATPDVSTATLSRMLTTVATVRDQIQLLRTIMTELQPLFGFHDVGLFVINEADDYHVDLSVDNPQINTSDIAFAMRTSVRGKLAHRDSVIAGMIKEIEAAGQPVLLDFAELKRRFPDYPQWSAMPDSYRDCLATTLKVQEEILGMFCINALEKGKLANVDRALFQLVADQLAVALSNVLSGEQLEEEKRFKETLLSISEAVASIQDRKHLFATIMDKIKPVFPFDDIGIFVNDESGQYQRDLAVDDDFGTLKGYKFIQGWLPRDPGIDHFITHGPLVKSLSELMIQYPDHPHYPAL